MERIPLNFIPDYPPITQAWAIGSVICSVLVDFNYVNHVDLVYSPQLVFQRNEYWRLLTCFLYMGSLDLNFFMNLYNIMTYSKQLEEMRSLRSRFDYLWFILVNCSLLILYATYYKNHYFLSTILTDSLMYYFARQNPDLPMGILGGIFEFRAAYFGFFNVLIGILTKMVASDGSLISMSPSLIIDSLTGLILGHTIFYFDEVFKKLHGYSPISAPWEWNWNRFLTRIGLRTPVRQVAPE